MKHLLSTAAACLLVAQLAASPVDAADIVLKYSPFVTNSHYVNTEIVMPFAAEVEKATDGRVRIEMLPKMVGSLGAQYDVCRDGLADICLPVLGYTPDRFPLAAIGELPFTNYDEVAADSRFHDFYMEHLGKYGEFKEVAPLSLFTFSGHNLFLKGKKINSIDDFSGLKIRVSGPNSVDLLKALGGVPILKPTNEVFELLSTGTIDGVVTADEGLLAQGHADVVDQVYVIPGGFTDSVFALVVNNEKWAMISPEDQGIMAELAGGNVGAAAGRVAAAGNQRGRDEARRKNVSIEPLSDAVFAAMKERATLIDDRWVAGAEKAGVADAADILGKFRQEMEAFK